MSLLSAVDSRMSLLPKVDSRMSLPSTVKFMSRGLVSFNNLPVTAKHPLPASLSIFKQDVCIIILFYFCSSTF